MSSSAGNQIDQTHLYDLIDEAQLHLGHELKKDQVEGEALNPIQMKAKNLLRHVMALGSSGSGKTVFCKVVVEEMSRLGLPAICIDPQGDLCSLALALSNAELEELESMGIAPELAQQFRDQVEVVVFTPASRRGIPLCADPLNMDVSDLDDRERIESISNIATMITSLIGFDLSSDDGEGIRAAFDSYLNILFEHEQFPHSLEEFGEQLTQVSDEVMKELERFVNPKKLSQALRKLARLDVGARRLLFHEGLPLNIDLLLGRGEHSAAQTDKVRLSIIYLNTLNSAEDKEFLIAAVAEQLYAWMLRNPSKDPQALFYIDEVAPFIPPVKVPACKPSLSLIFKQARKYGVCCLMATQNPGDVDYKAMAQFGSWAIGRLTTRQDLKKIQPTLKSLDPDRADEIMKLLPTLQAGEFMLLSPDAFDQTIAIKTRWLYSKHETLDDRSIERLCDERWRERFLDLEKSFEQKETPSRQKTKITQVTSLETRSTVSKEAEEVASKKKSRSKSKASSSDSNVDATHDEGSQQDDVEGTLNDHIQELFAHGAVLNTSEACDALSASKAKVTKLLKNKVELGELSSYKQGRSILYYDPSSGARPDLDLGSKVHALIPKLSREEIQERIEANRQKSFLGFFGKDEDLESKRLVYHIVYQVSFQETVEKSGFSALFGDKVEAVEDSIYLDPESLKIFVYEPNKPIQLVDSPTSYASEIPDFDGVSDLTELSPSSVKFDEEAWEARQDEDTVRRSVKRKFSSCKIHEIRPVFLPVWQLRYQERGGHQVRIVYIDGLTGQVVNLHG